ncbi:hypothetical protein IB642_01210 [Allofrancisella guangzhouensis]|uniref:GT44 domain-containing protein n=2 Tax=Allofrancisella guangzhouensis TaxID=594679 RepID=A0A0A8E4D2_9GAMM|nr:glycosyltransferase [Allofrancisella guangzhouensis]AJC48873.1 hypothetical protein SD28_04130 [Allofrancisella guangzhouensis]MBK2043637.1 hypothetical protein [Allofrancisella guangzhouensis]
MSTCLWLDEPLFIKVSSKLKHFTEVKQFDEQLFKIKEEKLGSLMNLYNLFINNQLYAFASDIARIIILNHFSGIYLDCDIAPNIKYEFPSKLELQKIFNDCAPNGFYMQFVWHTTENGILFNFKNNNLLDLLQKLENMVSQDRYINDVNDDVNQFINFRESDGFKRINSSNFYQEYHNQLAAFKQKNVRKYREANAETFKNIIYKGEQAFTEDNPCPPWTRNIQTVYQQTVTSFKNDCRLLTTYQYDIYRKQVAKYFKSEQGRLLLYNWADPGFTRLTKLKDATNKIETMFIDYKVRRITPFLSYFITFLSYLIKSLKNYHHFAQNHQRFKHSNTGILRANALRRNLQMYYNALVNRDSTLNHKKIEKEIISEIITFAKQRGEYIQYSGIFNKLRVNDHSSMSYIIRAMKQYYKQYATIYHTYNNQTKSTPLNTLFNFLESVLDCSGLTLEVDNLANRTIILDNIRDYVI